MGRREQDMRGSDIQTTGLFSYASCEACVSNNHPLQAIRAIVDEALDVLSPDFEPIFSDRQSVDPAGEAAARPVVSGLLQDPLGASAHGT